MRSGIHPGTGLPSVTVRTQGTHSMARILLEYYHIHRSQRHGLFPILSHISTNCTRGSLSPSGRADTPNCGTIPQGRVTQAEHLGRLPGTAFGLTAHNFTVAMLKSAISCGSAHGSTIWIKLAVRAYRSVPLATGTWAGGYRQARSHRGRVQYH